MGTRMTVNGVAHNLDLPPDTPLLYVLRDELELNGAKYGCGVGQCGACTVLHDGHPLRSCLRPLADLQGASIVTLEGLAEGDALHPLQEAFLAEQAGQCGYCIPGMIMTAAGLLHVMPDADELAIRTALAGNLCRCGSHNRIIRAIARVARRGSA
ncbi:MAG: (2Fe-2S)-binding protein [Bradyrhizobium sp.]|nr:(2Fe-2S)-binding protein [Bradyrhizobium sp.]